MHRRQLNYVVAKMVESHRRIIDQGNVCFDEEVPLAETNCVETVLKFGIFGDLCLELRKLLSVACRDALARVGGVAAQHKRARVFLLN